MTFIKFSLVLFLCKLSVEDCIDQGSYCSSYQPFCDDPDYKDYLIMECQKTCNYCHLVTTTLPTTTLASSPPFTGSGGRDLQPGCGAKGMTNTRIVGGKNAKPGDWPWQVNIDYRFNTANPGHLCGGTLINQEWVLSAAHCFYEDQNKDNYWLKLGEHDLKTNSVWEQVYGIKELILHPQYEHIGFHYDLALLRLNSTARLNSRVQTACLADGNLTFPVGTECFITGWGLLQEYGTGPAILQQAKVPLVKQEKCITAYNQLNLKVTPQMFCAGYENGKVDACEGDSGGPLVCKVTDFKRNEEVWYLYGTISWGVGCARKGYYGVLANPKTMRSWIDSVAFKKNF
ncbi:prostasin isoform X2 [Hydra vulgaris]|uniref:Prostasin isoform X2 n=1 Tax=Hydra vulgaris TaxID=6087 RepID=A0ABM4CHP3_HYDVU